MKPALPPERFIVSQSNVRAFAEVHYARKASESLFVIRLFMREEDDPPDEWVDSTFIIDPASLFGAVRDFDAYVCATVKAGGYVTNSGRHLPSSEVEALLSLAEPILEMVMRFSNPAYLASLRLNVKPE